MTADATTIVQQTAAAGRRAGLSQSEVEDAIAYMLRVDGHFSFERIVLEVEAYDRKECFASVNRVSVAYFNGVPRFRRAVDAARREIEASKIWT